MEKYLNYLRKLEKRFIENNLEVSAAKIVLAAVLDCKVSELVRYYDEEISAESLEIIENYVTECIEGKPVQYVLNSSYFYGLDLYVDENVLIPRQETEELVEWVLNDFEDINLSVVDLGVGSGCISLAIKKNRPQWNVYGVDISKEALLVASENSKTTGLNVEYMIGDFLEPIIQRKIKVDVIVSNPPYIALDDLDLANEVKMHEPHLALFTKDADGLDCYNKILSQLSQIEFKCAYFEFGHLQKEKLESLIKSFGYECTFKKDLNKKDRMVKVFKV